MSRKKLIIMIWIFVLFLFIFVATDYFRAIFINEEIDNKNESNSIHDSVEVNRENSPKVSATVEEDKKRIAKLSIFGDNLVHESVLDYANLKAGGTGNREGYGSGFNFLPIYEKIREDIESADFSICNQSSLVGANDSPQALSGYPLFNSPSKLGKDLIALGFDGVNIANNHLLDMSDNGYAASVRFWKKENIKLIGGYDSSKDMLSVENKIIDVSGIRLALLSYTANTNGILAENSKTPIPYFTVNGTAIKKKMLEEDVKKCKEAADAVIVFINWANDNSNYRVNSFQKETASILANAGADVVIGTGPKVIQPIEWLSSEDGSHKTLCVFSLGNTLATMKYMDNLFGGYLTFNIALEDNEVNIENVLFNPTVIYYDANYSNISIVPLSEFTFEDFQNHGSNINYGFGTYSWYEQTLNQCIAADFLPAKFRR